MDNAAITPDFFTVAPSEAPEQFIPSKPNAELAQKQRNLASLVDHPGWDAFYDGFQSDIDRLLRLEGISLKNLTDQEIGRAFLVARESADLCQAQLARVTSLARVHKNVNHDE